MASNDEKLTMSQSEFNQAIEIAVQKQRVDTLAEILENHEKKEDLHLDKIFEKIREVKEEMSEWPLKMNQCRDEMEKNMARDYVSEKIFSLEMARLDRKIDDQWKRITLAVVVAFAAIQFAFKLWGGS